MFHRSCCHRNQCFQPSLCRRRRRRSGFRCARSGRTRRTPRAHAGAAARPVAGGFQGPGCAGPTGAPSRTSRGRRCPSRTATTRRRCPSATRSRRGKASRTSCRSTSHGRQSRPAAVATEVRRVEVQSERLWLAALVANWCTRAHRAAQTAARRMRYSANSSVDSRVGSVHTSSGLR